jgi:hypothetical protein
MSTHTVVPLQAVVKIDVEIPFPSAAILGCGVMTGWGSVVNAARVEKGSSVVVLGCGGIGLSVVQGAVHACASKIIAVELNRQRLDLAVQFGATHTILATGDDTGLLQVAAEVRKLTIRGADYAFECTAVPALGAAPLAMVRNGGMAVAVSGIEEFASIDMQLFEWDKHYINPLYGQCRPFIDFPVLLSLYQQRRLKLDEMVTRTYALTGLSDAFEHMRLGLNAKECCSPMVNLEFPDRFDPIEISDPALELGHLRNLTFNSPALKGRGRRQPLCSAAVRVAHRCALGCLVARRPRQSLGLVHEGLFPSHCATSHLSADHREERAELDELQNRKPPAKEEGTTLAAKQAVLEMRPR